MNGITFFWITRQQIKTYFIGLRFCVLQLTFVHFEGALQTHQLLDLFIACSTALCDKKKQSQEYYKHFCEVLRSIFNIIFGVDEGKSQLVKRKRQGPKHWPRRSSDWTSCIRAVLYSMSPAASSNRVLRASICLSFSSRACRTKTRLRQTISDRDFKSFSISEPLIKNKLMIN